MPSWNIHLEVGRRISDKLKLSEKEKEEFLFGCILPDINNGGINKKVKIKRKHRETHWAFDEKSSLNFYARYKDEIDRKELIYLGYLVHLYTDGYFNYDFYRNIKREEWAKTLDDMEKLKMKHNDFWKYNIKFSSVKTKVSDKKEMTKKANVIDGVEIDEEAIEEVEELLNDEYFNEVMRDKPYLFYTEKRLDEILEGMVESFTKDYLEKENA